MSHTGIPPLKPWQVKVVHGELLASGEANFFDFHQHTSSTWNSATPSGSAYHGPVYYSPSGSWSTKNPNYIIRTLHLRHKEFLLEQNQEDGPFASKHIVASGINYPFPYPYNNSYPANVTGEMFSLAWWEASGIFKTYPESTFIVIDRQRESGILHWEGFKQVENLSNSPNVAPLVPEVTFNKYIHYLPEYPHHNHKISPQSNLEPPDYTDRRIAEEQDAERALLKLRKKQERKYIETEYLSDVNKRNLATGRLSYVYSEDGLFTGKQTNVGYSGGMCVYPDGTCKNGISEQACIAYPGAIWTLGEFCED